MNLANSSIRTFSVVATDNSLIFSTISLSGQFSTELSRIPLVVNELNNKGTNVQYWQTNERTCCLLQFPVMIEKAVNGQVFFEQFPVFVFSTAENQMSTLELYHRTIIYFRVCQALLQPAEFRPPGSFQMVTLSTAPSYLISILCSAEKLITEQPNLLKHLTLQAQAVNQRILETDVNSLTKILRKTILTIPQQNEPAATQLIQDILLQTIIVVFQDNCFYGAYCADWFNPTVNLTIPQKFDQDDLIVLSILQSDEYFMSGQPFSYQVQHSESHSVLSLAKQYITDEPDPQSAIITQQCDELPGKRVIQMRSENKLISAVVQIQKYNLDPGQHSDQKQSQISVCFINHIKNKLGNVLSQQCGDNLKSLIQTCDQYIQTYLVEFDRALHQQLKQQQIQLKQTVLTKQLQNHNNIHYFSISNYSKGQLLVPVQYDMKTIDLSMDQFDANMELHAENGLVIQNELQTKQFIAYKQNPQQKYTQHQNNDQIVRTQQQTITIQQQLLLSQQHGALENGLSFQAEKRGNQYFVFWMFFYNVSQNITFNDNFGQRNQQQNAQTSHVQQLWNSDINHIPIVIGKSQLQQLNSQETLVLNKRQQYSETGGYLCSPQYFNSLEKQCQQHKQLQKHIQKQLGANLELFEVQAIYNNLHCLEEAKEITYTLFKKYAAQVWSDK